MKKSNRVCCAPEWTRLVFSVKATRLALPVPARYFALDEPQRERFAGILPHLVRGIPRRDFYQRGAAVRLVTLGVLLSARPPTGNRIETEREQAINHTIK